MSIHEPSDGEAMAPCACRYCIERQLAGVEEAQRIEAVAERLAAGRMSTPPADEAFATPTPLPWRQAVWPDVEAFLRRNEQL